MNRMRKIILCTLVMAITGIAMTSCTEEHITLPGTGITGQTWAETNQADIKGEVLSFDFTAEDSWQASSSEKWCKVVTKEGGAGASTLRLRIEANEELYGRSAVITVKLASYEQPCTFTVQQGDGFIEQGDGKYREANQWIYDMMSEYYLWNSPIPSLTLDFSIEYDDFMVSMLDGIASVGNDINKEDGHIIDGQRVYFTNVMSDAPITKGMGDTFTDSGILKMQATKFDISETEEEVGLAIVAVTPGTAADKAGLKRGDFINEVDGIEVTESNYSTLADYVYNGGVTIKVNDVVFNNSIATVTHKDYVDLGTTTYEDQSIYAAKVLENIEYNKKVGYLLYMFFDMKYDAQLLGVFDQFKQEGIDELIIDLRYNNGGHVLSSTMLGTLVAGEEYKGQIYTKSVYNSNRTAAGTVGEYRIGEAANPESEEGYSFLVDALTKAVNLKKVYLIVSESTASASELLINGLRGLDIEVNLIGSTTMGKNVGMEGFQASFRNYTFILYPVTFYCENAKGFHDYSAGFTPELEVSDANIYPGDFGSYRDYLSNFAINWAVTGTKPSTTKASDGPATVEMLPLDGPDRISERRIEGMIVMR